MRVVHQHGDAVVSGSSYLRGDELRGVERVQLRRRLLEYGDADEDGDELQPQLHDGPVRGVQQHRIADLYTSLPDRELRDH
jgi:hypothetical protein